MKANLPKEKITTCLIDHYSEMMRTLSAPVIHHFHRLDRDNDNSPKDKRRTGKRKTKKHNRKKKNRNIDDVYRKDIWFVCIHKFLDVTKVAHPCTQVYILLIEWKQHVFKYNTYVYTNDTRLTKRLLYKPLNCKRNW